MLYLNKLVLKRQKAAFKVSLETQKTTWLHLGRGYVLIHRIIVQSFSRCFTTSFSYSLASH